MEALLGQKLLKGGSEVDTSSVKGAFVALYFSAHWCPPCRQFTPSFAKVYKQLKEQSKSFDVVFVSSDRDEASFREYFATMPWHAVPFSNRVLQQTLGSRFGVRGIPAVVLLRSDGSVYNAQARAAVMEPGFASTLPRVSDVSLAVTPATGPTTVRVLHKREEIEIEVEPEEGWELLRTQVFSVTEIPAEQQRLFGLGVSHGPVREDIPLAQALGRGLLSQRGSGLSFADVPGDARSYNAHYEPQNLNDGRLNSERGWSAKKGDESPWYQMDMGARSLVAGVVIAPRRDYPQWVTAFKVTVADVEGGPWTHVGGDGFTFEGNGSWTDPPLRVPFPEACEARYIRIHPTAFRDYRSLRADVLLASGEPDKPPLLVVLGNFSEDDPFEVAGETSGNSVNAMVQEQHLAFLQVKLQSAPPRLQNEIGSLKHVSKYEDPKLQRQALDAIPVVSMARTVAEETGVPAEGFELAFMRQVLKWFKHDFFSWTNSPKCENCGSSDTQNVGTAPPSEEDKYFGAGCVEVAQCKTCGAQTRFPRYNDPAKLLQTRTGRCGEYANCFTLVCRALGYEARKVNDWTDHVWTEIYSDSLARWVHCDSCEAALDVPLVYEQGWGKKLTYCLAFGRDNACDVTRRYTKKYPEVLGRRGEFQEQQLERVMSALDEFARDQSLGSLAAPVAEARRASLSKRAEAEIQQLAASASADLKAEEQIGRTSGDSRWREDRGELGANADAKAKALACSSTGIASSAPPPKVPGSWLGSAENFSLKDGILTADLKRTDGEFNRGVTVRVEPGTAYYNDDGRFMRDATAKYSLGSISSGVASDKCQVFKKMVVPEGLEKLTLSCRWKDQGDGNRKGRLFVVIRRGQDVTYANDCFGVAGHGWETQSRSFAAEELKRPQCRDVLSVEYIVGGGGGHHLYVEDLEVTLVRNLSPAPAAVASSGYPAPAATPTAEVTPAAAAPTKEEMQARVKKIFAELVQSGMAPNEAAVKAIEQAKTQLMSAA